MKVEQESLNRQLAGHCCELAVALHRATGWPMRAEFAGLSEGRDALVHAWVVNPDGRAVDIAGVHDTDYAAACKAFADVCGGDVVVPLPFGHAVHPVGEEDMHALSDKYLRLAESAVKCHPGHFGLARKAQPVREDDRVAYREARS